MSKLFFCCGKRKIQLDNTKEGNVLWVNVSAYCLFVIICGCGQPMGTSSATVRNKMHPTVIQGLISGQPLLNGSPKVIDVITVVLAQPKLGGLCHLQ